MKRHADLFPQVVDWSNLLRAARRARRGKLHRPNVAEFEFFQEWELLRLQEELSEGVYRPGRYRSFVILQPKRRLISAAPYRDRIVHHALCQVVEPLFDRSFIFDSYACRKGKGTHAAVRRAQQFSRRYEYVLKADVRQFFPTVDHGVLLKSLDRKLKDRWLRQLWTTIVEHPFPGQQLAPYFAGDDLFTPLSRSCGLPIGNQTSQFLANVMLDPLDQFIKRRLGRPAYVRYADDFLLFGDDRARLCEDRERIRRFLASRRLKLHERKSVVFPVRCGIPFLGYRIFPTHVRLGAANIRRMRKRLRTYRGLYASGRITSAEIRASVTAWWGHAQHASAMHLARDLLHDYSFVRRSQ